jgi:hypothetical protein
MRRLRLSAPSVYPGRDAALVEQSAPKLDCLFQTMASNRRPQRATSGAHHIAQASSSQRVRHRGGRASKSLTCINQGTRGLASQQRRAPRMHPRDRPCSDSIVRPAVRALPSTSENDTTMGHLAPMKRPEVRLAPRFAGVHVGSRPALRAAEKALRRLAPPRCLPGHLSRLLSPRARGDRYGSQMDGNRAHLTFDRLVQRCARDLVGLGHGGADNACGMHEIRGGTDGAAPSQRSTRGQAPRRRLTPTPVTVVMLVRLLDNSLPCEIKRTDRCSRFIQAALIIAALLE